MDYFINRPHKFNPFNENYDQAMVWQYFTHRPYDLPEWRRRYVPPDCTYYCDQCMVLRQDCQGGDVCQHCRDNDFVCSRHQAAFINMPFFEVHGQIPGQPPIAKFPGPSRFSLPETQSPPSQLQKEQKDLPGKVDMHGGIAGNDVARWNVRPLPWPLPIPDGMTVVMDGSDEDEDDDEDEDGDQAEPRPFQKRGGGKEKVEGIPNRGPVAKPKCETCIRRCRGRHQCNMDPYGPNPVGCTECSLWGLYCVYQGAAYPPRQLTGLEFESKVGECEPCRRNKRVCDRKRPCDSCILHNEERCAGRSQANCFWRGAPGDNLPMYYYRLRHGAGGVNTDLPEGLPRPNLPPNYHLTYEPDGPGQDPARRPFPGMPAILDAPPNPPPPGPWSESKMRIPMKQYDINDFRPVPDPLGLQVPDSLFADLTDVDLGQLDNQRRIEYEGVWRDVVSVVREGSNIIAAGNIRNHLINNAVEGIPWALSELTLDIKRFLQDRWRAIRQHYITEVSVALPPDAVENPAAIEKYHPGNLPIQNVTIEPVRRAPSPGPPIPTHGGDTGELMNVNAFHSSFPVGHPSRPDVTKLIRPIPSHPHLKPALANIPLVRLHIYGQLTNQPVLSCLVQNKNGVVCGKPASACCEDTTHVHGGFPICNQCEQESRNRFIDFILGSSKSLRAFCCAACCHDISTNPSLLTGSGLRIWGLESSFPNAQPTIHPRKAPFVVQGGFMGERLGLTGCSCGTKMLDRYICNAHRFQHSINLRLAQENLDKYTTSVYGTTEICPACHKNPSIRAFDFKGMEGAEGLPVVWQCKGCHELVVAPPGTELNIIHDGSAGQVLFANPNRPQFSVFSGGGRMSIAGISSLGSPSSASSPSSDSSHTLSSRTLSGDEVPQGVQQPSNGGPGVPPGNQQAGQSPLQPRTPDQGEIPPSQEDIYGATPIQKTSPGVVSPPPNQGASAGGTPGETSGGPNPVQGDSQGGSIGGIPGGPNPVQGGPTSGLLGGPNQGNSTGGTSAPVNPPPFGFYQGGVLGPGPGFINPQLLNINSNPQPAVGGLFGGGFSPGGTTFPGSSLGIDPQQLKQTGNAAIPPGSIFVGAPPTHWQLLQEANRLAGASPIPKGNPIPLVSSGPKNPFSLTGYDPTWAPGQPGPGSGSNYQFPITPSPPGVIFKQPVGGVPGGTGKTPADGNMFGGLQPLDPNLFDNPPPATTTTNSPPYIPAENSPPYIPADNSPPTDSPPPLPPGYTHDDYLEWMLRLS